MVIKHSVYWYIPQIAIGIPQICWKNCRGQKGVMITPLNNAITPENNELIVENGIEQRANDAFKPDNDGIVPDNDVRRCGYLRCIL